MSGGASIRGVRDSKEVLKFVRRLSGPDPEQKKEPRSG